MTFQEKRIRDEALRQLRRAERGAGRNITMKQSKGRVTIPTDFDVVPQTLEIMER